MHVTARAEYAVRALVELAANGGGPMTAEAIATAQDIPERFLKAILGDLRRDGLLVSIRGAEGGYRLGRAAGEISVAEAIRAIDGPLAYVRGVRPHELSYDGSAEPLRDVWIAARSSLRAVLEHVTIADVASGRLPKVVRSRLDDGA